MFLSLVHGRRAFSQYSTALLVLFPGLIGRSFFATVGFWIPCENAWLRFRPLFAEGVSARYCLPLFPGCVKMSLGPLPLLLLAPCAKLPPRGPPARPPGAPPGSPSALAGFTFPSERGGGRFRLPQGHPAQRGFTLLLAGKRGQKRGPARSNGCRLPRAFPISL